MLDIGAGRGIASFAFAKDGWQVTALEPDQSDIVGSGAIKNLADHENLAITVVNEWGETLPFDNSSFDLVYVRAVLHHARDLQRFCSEIVRVLKPNGMLLAVREHVISKTDDLETFLYVHPLHKLYGGENAFLLKEYKDAMISAGFDIVRTIKPFENPINFSPQSRRSLCGEILNRVKIVPAGLKDILLSRNFVLSLLLRLAGLLDNRPGRHYSFVCIKPGL